MVSKMIQSEISDRIGVLNFFLYDLKIYKFCQHSIYNDIDNKIYIFFLISIFFSKNVYNLYISRDK